MIDLHMHTVHSDGSNTVDEVLRIAEDKGLSIISITDHDCVDAYREIKDNNIFTGSIIKGVELKTFYDGVPMEVLGYGIDPEKLKIHKVDMYEIQSKSLSDLKRIGKSIGLKFDDSIEISKTDPKKSYASFVFSTEILKYEENKEILLKYGPEFDNVTFYRVHSSNKESIFYFDESDFGQPLDETIDAIHEAGGLAFLAHPLMYPFKDKFKSIEDLLINFKLDGLECIYPLFSDEDKNKLMELARKYDRYISGGTDYHGENKPNIMLGTGIDNNNIIDEELISNWVSKVL